jgi:hypothetical protein
MHFALQFEVQFDEFHAGSDISAFKQGALYGTVMSSVQHLLPVTTVHSGLTVTQYKSIGPH